MGRAHPARASRPGRFALGCSIRRASRPRAKASAFLQAPARRPDPSNRTAALVGDRQGLAKRIASSGIGGEPLVTDAKGVAKIRYDQLFGQSSTPAALLAIDAEHGMGVIGLLDPDTNHPEITLHMAPLCDVTAPILAEKLLDASEPIQVRLLSEMGTMLLITTLSDAAIPSATAGRCLHAGRFQCIGRTAVGGIYRQGRSAQTGAGSDRARANPAGHAHRPSGPRVERDRRVAQRRPVKLSDLHGKVVILDFGHISAAVHRVDACSDEDP